MFLQLAFSHLSGTAALDVVGKLHRGSRLVDPEFSLHFTVAPSEIFGVERSPAASAVTRHDVASTALCGSKPSCQHSAKLPNRRCLLCSSAISAFASDLSSFCTYFMVLFNLLSSSSAFLLGHSALILFPSGRSRSSGCSAAAFDFVSVLFRSSDSSGLLAPFASLLLLPLDPCAGIPSCGCAAVSPRVFCWVFLLRESSISFASLVSRLLRPSVPLPLSFEIPLCDCRTVLLRKHMNPEHRAVHPNSSKLSHVMYILFGTETCSSLFLYIVTISPLSFSPSSFVCWRTTTICSRLRRSHRCLSGFLLTVLVSHTPALFPTMISPGVALKPKNIPSLHMYVSISSGLRLVSSSTLFPPRMSCLALLQISIFSLSLSLSRTESVRRARLRISLTRALRVLQFDQGSSSSSRAVSCPMHFLRQLLHTSVPLEPHPLLRFALHEGVDIHGHRFRFLSVFRTPSSSRSSVGFSTRHSFGGFSFISVMKPSRPTNAAVTAIKEDRSSDKTICEPKLNM